MPIAGFTRLRKHQQGKQSSFGTPVTATRVFPYRGALVVDPHWTDPDVDVGSIDPSLPPYRMGIDVTSSMTGQLDYDSIPTFLAAGMIGGVTPTGAGQAKTWTFTAQSTTTTTLDNFTDEWSDDFTGDGAQAFGGIINSIQWGFGVEMGAWDATSNWMFANINRPVTPTAGLSACSNYVNVFGTDTSLWINDTAGTIGTTQISDALSAFSQTITNTIDVKRFANGSNPVGRFGVNGFGLSGRVITSELTFHKTTESVAEVAKWLNASPQERFIEIRNISPTLVPTTATPYSFNIKLAGEWRSRTDGEEGGNAVFTLSHTARYNASGLTYAYRGTVVNSRSAL